MLCRAICLAAVCFAVMNVQRAATDLILGKYDVAAVALQDAHRRVVYVAEQKRHDAAVEHGDFGSARADGGKVSASGAKKLAAEIDGSIGVHFTQLYRQAAAEPASASPLR